MNHSKQKTAIIVAGPTAVGKTALAIRLAQHFSTSIISADSRQCYQELDIGVAKPSAAELSAVRHFFISSHSIQQQVDVAVYEQYALQSLQEVFSKKDTAIVVGGTGLYIKALCEGVDEMPAIPPAIRQQVRDGFHKNGSEWLQAQIAMADPIFFAKGEMQNPHRMMRALEFVMATGVSIKAYQKGEPKKRPFNIIKIGLELPREQLNQRINERVDDMLREGLLAEATELLPHQQLKALQTVGYQELFDHLNGNISLEAAIELIKTNTRQYAKRQMTWFKKDSGFKWFGPGEYEEVLTFLKADNRINNF